MHYADLIVYVVDNFSTKWKLSEEITIPEDFSIIWPEPTLSKQAQYQVNPGMMPIPS